jgi:hypothetical protein
VLKEFIERQELEQTRWKETLLAALLPVAAIQWPD